MTTPAPDLTPSATDLAASPTGVAESSFSPASPTVNRAGRRSLLRVVLIGGAVIVACLAGIVGIFGRVSGTEFAPSHFQSRDFSFVEIPLLRLQITPIRRTGQYSPLATYLRTAALIPRPQGPPTQWHLVELRRIAAPSLPGDAKLLSDFLSIESGISGSYWQQWSIKHPELAAVLWPEIQKLAERELYLLIPDLFQIAALATSADSMEHDIHAYLVSNYEGLIRDLRSAGQAELAESFRQEAMSDYPGDPRWLQL